MLFVVSCGNGGISGLGYSTDTYPVYPASFPYDNIISVANLLFDGSLSKDSNYGANSVDIAAPGSYILSTIPGNTYGFMSGTSMAAPMVTGAAAMVYSYRQDISLSEVKNIILNSSRKLDSLTGKMVSGGLLDAYGALTWQ
jgi:subtilisin family serine protease